MDFVETGYSLGATATKVSYIVGMARNARLQQDAQQLQKQAKEWFELRGKKQRLFQDFVYAADSWRWLRLVIHKAEHTAQGSNPRFVVTNLPGDPQELYDKVYCGRGEMENRIKEQMQLFSERTSAHQWWANQWPIALVGAGLHLDGSHAPVSLKRDEVGAGPMPHPAAQINQDRSGHRAQHPNDSLSPK